jgi:hypothetical protein
VAVTGGRSRRGAALGLVLVALVLIGALGGLAVGAARRDRHEATIALRSIRALAAAESGIASALAAWPAGDAGALAPGAYVELAAVAVAPGDSFALTVARLAGELFLVRSEGRAGSARRTVAQLVRIHPAALLPEAALASLGAVRLDSAAVSGEDSASAGWGAWCSGGPAPDVAGVRVGDAASVSADPGCAGLTCLAGAPPLLADTALSGRRAGFLAAFDSVAARADRVAVGDVAPAPSADASGCAVAQASNWGEPDAAVPQCAGWLPVVVAPGNLRLVGGRGQGVLLVRGDLELDGGAEFVGPVVVLGTLRIAASGGRILGGVLAFGGAELTAGAVVRAACAVRRGAWTGARPRPLTGGWVELD